jgi:hypothetical protein
MLEDSAQAVLAVDVAMSTLVGCSVRSSKIYNGLAIVLDLADCWHGPLGSELVEESEGLEVGLGHVGTGGRAHHVEQSHLQDNDQQSSGKELVGPTLWLS